MSEKTDAVGADMSDKKQSADVEPRPEVKKRTSGNSTVKTALSYVAKISMVIVVLFLTVYLITILTGSDDFYRDSAERNALVYFDEDLSRVSALAEKHYENLYEIADKTQYAESHDAVADVIESYVGSEQFGDLRFYSRGVGYSSNGLVVEGETSGSELIDPLVASKTAGCTDVYFDSLTNKYCIAFFIPVRGSAYVDGILSMVEARNIITVGGETNEKATSVAIINRSEMILADTTAEDFGIKLGNDYGDFLMEITADREMVAVFTDALSENKKTACTIDALGERYTLALSPIDAFDDNLILVTMSKSEGLIAPELTYIRHLVNVIIIAIAAIIIGFVYSVLYYSKLKTAVDTASLTDPAVGCANAEAFCRVAAAPLRSEGHAYAVTALSIRQFRYMVENVGSEKSIEILRHVAKVIETFCNDRETYAYNGDGTFLLLISYQSERSIKEKVKLIETVSNKHDILRQSRSKLKFNVGISLSLGGAKHYTPKDLIDRALAAAEQAKTDIRTPYVVYNEKVKESREHDDRIEAQMESALENREFRLFLQPKYNVSGDKVDSAEALVRWFDPRRGEYMFPGEFIGLFESNGFITKLDHFVYIEVLEYLSSAAERGDKIVPIAVNVSRVTASSPDFLNFYVGNKRKYGIGDGFITLEFTESFAMEDYDKINEIVTYLHKNGMRCSIDDFGTGYSSFSILKQIPMDELKLDRLFLEPGVNKKNDDVLLETVISLAKSLGMTVVQEGVETKAMFDRAVSMGCDIVQGYYYAKGIPLEEYKLFIKSNTSIKYKSLVK